MGNYVSDRDTVRFGVPQGSVLGPFLFTLYTYPLAKFLTDSDLDFHGYVDDKQLYKCFFINSLTKNVSNIELRISQVHTWMVVNKLKLNGPKTEFMILGKKQMLDLNKPCLKVEDTLIAPAHSVRNLGVIFDENLTMNEHIDNVCRSMFSTIRSISLNRDFLTIDVTTKLMISLVLSKLDYCNSLLAGLPDFQINKLQRVQNIAAKIIFRKRKYDHVTPLFFELHWLPVKERIDFKISTICYKTFNNCSPIYISSLIEKPTRMREMRSSNDTTLLKVPPKKLKTYGERSFSFYGPKLWNSIPREIRESPTLEIFKKIFKTLLIFKGILLI